MAKQKSFKLGFKELPFELTEKQKSFLEIMTDDSSRVVFLSGVAGTSKTMLSVYAALLIFNEDARKKINYLRTPVESADRSLGALKGTLEEKMNPYISTVYDKTEELLQRQSYEIFKNANVISGQAVNFLRGKTFLNTCVIADEVQNFTQKEILLTLSRLGMGSKIFLCADSMQTDIKQSGFELFYESFDNEESREKGIHCLRFDKSDIVRDPLISYMMDVYEDKILK